MKFKFTYHAQSQMNIRGLSLIDLKNIIARPDFSRREESDIIVSVKEVVGKGKIGVVFKKLLNHYLIVTVYYANKK
jgi:hypothetical protein